MIRYIIALLAIAVVAANAALYTAWGNVWNLRSALVAGAVTVLALASLHGTGRDDVHR